METSKEMEIKQLTKLCEIGGYYSQFFGEDLTQMIENIKNDFPIEYNTKLQNTIEEKEVEIKNLQSENQQTIRSICEELICTEFEQIAIENIGRLAVIRYKRDNGLEVSEKDVDFLLTNCLSKSE